ncbi:MAG: sodium/glutamate symporter, partial [Proteiniphilum sp.]|nr:sodium/glutamate symporter [Proteiniphilum sp.]
FMTLQIDLYESVGLAVLLLLLGKWLKSKIYFFRKYAIPSPVIGGLLFAFVTLFLQSVHVLSFQFDNTLQSFFMTIFFTSIGFNVSLKLLYKGGAKLLLFLGLATIFSLFQNIIPIVLANPLGVDARLALMTGSTALMGGLGTSAAIAPQVEEIGVTGAHAVAIASATFGLLMGSLMGAPIGNNLITRKKLYLNRKTDEEEREIDALRENSIPMNGERITKASFLILISMGIGVFFTDVLNHFMGLYIDTVKFPVYIGPMIVAAIIRNIFDARGNFDLNPEIQLLGDICLNVFISIAIMTLRLWELSELALPLMMLLLAQVVLMYLFPRFIAFPVLGKDYDAAVSTSGLIGFSMGSTANAMANLDSICDKFGYSRVAYFIVPVVGAFFIDFINVLMITGFLATIP